MTTRQSTERPPDLSSDLPSATAPVQSLLLRAVDCGLAAVIFVAPLVMGGRHPVGRLVFVACVCFTAVAWAASQALSRQARWTWSGAEFLAAAGALLLMFQLLPLPAEWIARLAPLTAERLPLWTSTGNGSFAFGPWPCLSLMPAETRIDLVMFLAYAVLFLVVVQRVQDLHDVERLLGWVALAAIGMAALGLAQFLAGNGKFLWVYQHPSRDTLSVVKGTFANENHFAHFLALGLPALLWGVQRALSSRAGSRHHRHREARPGGKSWFGGQFVLAAGLGLVSFAALLSFSRGGVLAIFVSSTVCVALYTWRGLFGRKALTALAGVGLVVAAGLLIFGFDPLTQELETLNTTSLDSLDIQGCRRTLWAADLQAFVRTPWLGTGAGTHEEVYPTFYPRFSYYRYTHAESGYIQVLLETGVAGLTLLLLGWGVCGYWCVRALSVARDERRDACTCAVVAALAVSLVHAVWDFVWYIPACLSVTLVLAACGYRLFALSAGESSGRSGCCRTLRLSRLVWLAGTAGVVVLSWGLVRSQLAPAAASGPWERFEAEARNAERHQDESALVEQIPVLIEHLEQTVAADPDHAQANLRLAALYLAQFNLRRRASENPMSLDDLRAAAVASRFPSRQALMEWLAVVAGDDVAYLEKSQHHLRRAVRLCPLLGPAYVHLSQLAFLQGAGRETNAALTEQALLVRPHSGPVLFSAGANAATAGELDQALAYWKQAFHQDPTYRTQLIERLAPQIPAAQMLAEFQPGLEGLAQLYTVYRRLGRDDQAREVAPQYTELLEAKAAAADAQVAVQHWACAEGVYQFLGDTDSALRCIRRAVDCAPEDYALRQRLAAQLIAGNLIDEALEQLQWCRRRKPDDASVQQLWTYAERQRSAETLALPTADAAARETPAEPDARADGGLGAAAHYGPAVLPAEDAAAGRPTSDARPAARPSQTRVR